MSIFRKSVEKFQISLKSDSNNEHSTRLKQACVYSDDVVLVTRTEQALINTFQKIKQLAEKYGLTINQNKIKHMRHSRTETNGKEMEIELEVMKIEEVSKTKYLGTTVTRDNLLKKK